MKCAKQATLLNVLLHDPGKELLILLPICVVFLFVLLAPVAIFRLIS